MREKYLVDINFKYLKIIKVEGEEDDSDYVDNVITIGIYDDFDTACTKGNELLEYLESKFELHKFPDGRLANKKRFSRRGGCFGSKVTLVSNLAYLKTPFDFYASITTLKYEVIGDVIENILNDKKT